jgi:hypothetical protein
MTTTFETEPPTITVDGTKVKLRPLAPLAWRRIQRAQELTDEFGDTAIALGYVITHSGTPAESARASSNDETYRAALNALALGITLEDLQAVADYLSGVLKRAEEAAVETPEK